MANRREWAQNSNTSETPNREKFLKRKYKKGEKRYKRSLRDHRRSVGQM